MREVLKVHLHNEERFYTELTLPASPYTMLDALEKLRLSDGAPYDWYIADKLLVKSLAAYMDLDGSIFDLNALCQQLATLDDRQLAIVEGLAKMECTDAAPRVPLPRLLDMAYSTDCCHHVEEATNDYTLGRFCAENGFVPEADDLSDEAYELLDFAKIGREFRQNEGGVFTSGGYVQRHDELRKVYETLDLKPKKPDYTILAATYGGDEIRLPYPPHDSMGTEPVRCVDCAAPSLIGVSGGLEQMNLLARWLSGMETAGTLPKYKAVLTATGCDDLDWALKLANDLEQYMLDPKCRTPEEVAESAIHFAVPQCEIALLRPSVNLYQYGQDIIRAGGGQLTGYGLIERVDGQPVLSQEQRLSEGGMEMM